MARKRTPATAAASTDERDGLRCPACKHVSTAREVLAACSISWPNQGWVLFVCPACKEHHHVEAGDGQLVLGELDGAPGPCFFPIQTLDVPGLRVKRRGAGVTLTLHGARTLVPARK